MAGLNATSFSKCAPSIGTNIRQCGTVTLCNSAPATVADLNDAYLDSAEYRVLDALLKWDFEIKQCEARQNTLYDFLMANKVAMTKGLRTTRLASGVTEVAPFVIARQYSAINNAYWKVENGVASGPDWSVLVTSSANIPFDVRSFPPGMQVSIHGKSAGGSATRTTWKVVTVTDNGNNTGTLVLESLNSGSYADPDKLGSPVTGLLRRMVPNVNKFEKFCAEQPAYLNWKNVPFWIGGTRWDTCTSSNYQKRRKLLLSDIANNTLYKEFGDLEETQKNKQLAKDFQQRFTDAFFWSMPFPNQNPYDYDQLDDITAFDGGTLGVDGGKCVGKRANPVGVYEQMWQCGRVADYQGGKLNLPKLWKAIYAMMRVRDDSGFGASARQFDLFMDSLTAARFNKAMLAYYDNESGNLLQLNMPVEGFQIGKKADFGFFYRSYPLNWPYGVWINVITHNYFDDALSAAKDIGQEATQRVIWILDFAGIYPGIIESKVTNSKTGDRELLARLVRDFACVQEVNWEERTLYGMTWGPVLECPAGNLIIENFDDTVPEAVLETGIDLPVATTSTTTTTAADID